jgi:hypothetical protein
MRRSPAQPSHPSSPKRFLRLRGAASASRSFPDLREIAAPPLNRDNIDDPEGKAKSVANLVLRSFAP